MVNVVAHRGFSGRFPENTLKAFLEAVTLGVNAIEFDVQLTRDGGLVLVHDGTVDRTTNGSGRVDRLSLSEIKELDAGGWLDSRFKGEKIPTLAEALEAIDAPVRLNIHLKPAEQNRRDMVSLAVGELERRGDIRRGFITADQETIELVKILQPQLDICNLTTEPRDTYITRSLALGCRILQPRNAWVDHEFVRQAHDAGMEVDPFYANDPQEMRRLIDCGVDGILTDYPDVLLELRRRG